MRGLQNITISGLITCCVLALFPRAVCADPYIYWTDASNDRVGRAGLDGSNVNQTFITSSSNFPIGIIVAAHGIYWANQNSHTVTAVGLDGSGAVAIPSVSNTPQGVALDSSYLYWSSAAAGAILRAELDGSSAAVLTTASGVFHIAINSQYIFWTTSGGSRVGRADLDGSNADPNFIVSSQTTGLAVDENYVYWGKDSPDAIARANIDGTGIDANFISTTDFPWALALNSEHIFWANSFSGSIGRASLDGTGVNQNFITGIAGLIFGVALSPSPTFSVSPTTHNFGNTNVDATSSSQDFVVQNLGLGLLNISDVSLTGADSAQFSVGANTCTTSVAPSASCTVSATFEPSIAGAATANLTFTHDGSSSPDDVALAGTGIPTPTFSVSPTTYDFGNTNVGAASASQNFVVQNTGLGTLNISGVNLAGAGAAQFSIGSNGCTSPVAAAGSCAVAVSFSPSVAGAATAQLAFNHDAAGSPNSLTLSGSGISASGGAPEISNLLVSPSRLRKPISRLDISFDLSQAASVKFVLYRKYTQKERKACDRKRARKRQRGRCSTHYKISSRRVEESAGTNLQVRFNARMPLSGTYRINATASNAYGSSPQVRTRFRKR